MNDRDTESGQQKKETENAMSQLGDVGRPLGRAAHDGFDPGDEFLDAKRFDHVVVGPVVQPADPVGLFAAGRKDDDRQRRPRTPNLFKDFKPIAPRQHKIQKQQIEKFQKLNMPPGAMEIAEKHIQRMMTVLAEAAQWAKLKDDMISCYTAVYTEAELKELIEFYQTPLGQKMVAKMPQLAQQTLQISQKHMFKAGPEMTAISNELIAELKEKYPQQ